MDTDPHAGDDPAQAGAGQEQHTDRLTPLLTTATAGLGLLVTVTALNVDRSWRLAAIGLGVAGIAVSLVAFRLSRRHRRQVTGAGVALLVAAGAVLVASPPVRAPAAAKPRSQLKLSQFDVVGGTYGKLPMFDITVHNLGKRRAVLTGVRLKISDYLFLPICISEGSVESSKPYPVPLPYKPAAGTVVTIPLHEEVGADQVDRFQVALHEPQPKVTDSTGYTYTVVGTFVYRLSATLTADVQNSLPLGQAIVGTPQGPYQGTQVWNPDDPQRVTRFSNSLGPGNANSPDIVSALPCMEKSSAALKHLLAGPGRRSNTLAHVLTNTPEP